MTKVANRRKSKSGTKITIRKSERAKKRRLYEILDRMIELNRRMEAINEEQAILNAELAEMGIDEEEIETMCQHRSRNR